jgi:hypothetical protein
MFLTIKHQKKPINLLIKKMNDVDEKDNELYEEYLKNKIKLMKINKTKKFKIEETINC